MKNSCHIVTLLITLLSVNTLSAQSYLTKNGRVEFESRASKLTFKGVSRDLHGLINFDNNLVDFYVDLNTIRTGITLRDKHMRESFLETDAFPFAEFTGKLTSPFDLLSNDVQTVTAEGEFTIHGVTKNISVTGTMQQISGSLDLKAGWEVVLPDYNIMRPQVLFLELSDTQKVSITVTLLPFED